MAVPGQEFSELVRRTGDGETDTVVSAELSRLLLELRNQAADSNAVVKGSITVKLTFSCNPKGMLDVAATHDVKRPKKVTLPTTAWVTKEGGVSFDMPRQTKLPLVDVAGPARVIVSDDGDYTPRNKA